MSLSNCGAYTEETSHFPEQTSVDSLGGWYWFSSLEENCEVAKVRLFGRTGGHDHQPGFECNPYSLKKDFLPLPRFNWAHPGTMIALKVNNDGSLRFRLLTGTETKQNAPYDTFTVYPEALGKQKEAMILPIGSSAEAFDWSLLRQPEGLRYSITKSSKGVFLFVPYGSKFDMTCLLPFVAHRPEE